METGRFGPSIAAIFVVAAWGASFVATRVALEVFTPASLVAIRLIMGVGVLGVLSRVRGGRVGRQRDGWGVIAVLGLILGAHLLIQAIGLEHTTAINTGWIIGFIPVVIAVGSVAFLRQRLSATAWFGVALGSIGVALVMARTPPEFASARLGDALQVMSCFTWAGYTLVGVRPVRRFGSLRVTTGAMTVAAIVLVAATLVDGRATVAPLTPASGFSLLFLGVVCSGVAYVLWFWVVDRIGAAQTGVYLYLEPFVTVAVASTLIGEPITVNAVVGGLVVLVGVWLVNRDGRGGEQRLTNSAA